MITALGFFAVAAFIWATFGFVGAFKEIARAIEYHGRQR